MPRGKLFPGEILPGAHRVLDVPRDIHSDVTTIKREAPPVAIYGADELSQPPLDGVRAE